MRASGRGASSCKSADLALRNKSSNSTRLAADSAHHSTESALRGQNLVQTHLSRPELLPYIVLAIDSDIYRLLERGHHSGSCLLPPCLRLRTFGACQGNLQCESVNFLLSRGCDALVAQTVRLAIGQLGGLCFGNALLQCVDFAM